MYAELCNYKNPWFFGASRVSPQAKAVQDRPIWLVEYMSDEEEGFDNLWSTGDLITWHRNHGYRDCAEKVMVLGRTEGGIAASALTAVQAVHRCIVD